METRRTPLYEFHLANGARMVPFAGWDMPVQYPDGIKSEHLATRASAGLFDVSHMAQVHLAGAGSDGMLEALTPTDVSGVAEGRVRYSMFLDANGGVLDDLMVARLDGDLHLVVNAGRAEHDIAHLKANLAGDVTMTVQDDRALLALQGPDSPAVMERLGSILTAFSSCRSAASISTASTPSSPVPAIPARTGSKYPFPPSRRFPCRTPSCGWSVSLAGLGARDTLRLEAGLPLWGHELDETINPVTAGLGFALSKRRRAAADFPGAAAILEDLATGPARRLVGLLPQGGRPVRDGAEIRHQGQAVGHVSSGGFSPTLDAPAALGFVDSPLAVAGTELDAIVRDRPVPMLVADLPLVPHRYIRG